MPSESSVKATAAPPPFPLPPDGGWGWVVVCASFISIGFSYAFPKAVTVFFNDIKDIFKTTSSQIAWISSIMLAVMYAGGPISSVLVNNYGSRPVVIVGGLLCCTGMILASFSSSVIELYLTVGFIGVCNYPWSPGEESRVSSSEAGIEDVFESSEVGTGNHIHILWKK